MEYQEAMEYLQSLTRFGFNFGLGRIEELVRRLGNPHRSLRVIHVGGTNGKGSTTAMVDSILRAAGYKTATFTSPHLHSYTERFCINGKEIARERLAWLISMLRPHLDAMVKEEFEHPTEFEVSTALAFQYFYEEKVDFLVLEVGLGGAIDSTNIVWPLVTVITNVSMDHMDYLGSTIQEIARIKAGIIKEGIPVVSATTDARALEVIWQVCQEKNAPLIKVEHDRIMSCERGETQFKESGPYRQVNWNCWNNFSLDGQTFTVWGLKDTYQDLFIPLLGRHQLANAATAVAAVELLTEQGYAVPREAFYRGLASVCWPARLEVLNKEPMVVIDGAHNYEGAKSLRRALEDYFPGRGIILVLGMLRDKEHARVIKELACRARTIIITRPDSPRAANCQQLAGEARLYTEEVYVIEDISDAVYKAMALARPDEVVCVTGSLYMVAEAREVLVQRHKSPDIKTIKEDEHANKVVRSYASRH